MCETLILRLALYIVLVQHILGYVVLNKIKKFQYSDI